MDVVANYLNMLRKLYCILFFLSIVGCNNQKKEELEILPSSGEVYEEKSLLDNVKLAINPKFQDWVLFENGTYIIFDDISQVDDIEKEAIKLIKEYGLASAGNSSGDFGVIALNETKGWAVSGHGYGIYTYIHPSELNSSSPSDLTIGTHGRNKRVMDARNPKIIYVSQNN